MEELKKAAPDFVTSEEYRLHRGECDDMPTIVLDSFRDYLFRLAKTQASSASFASGLKAMATIWRRADAREYFEQEFFQELVWDPAAEFVIVPAMEKDFRMAFEDWADSHR